MATNIPKFASFRPKPKEAPQPAKESSKSERSNRSSKDKSSKDRDSRHEVEYPRRSEKETSKLFFSDRRGDRDILKYGSINRYDVPTYRRYGHGYILGLSTDWKIDRELSTEAEIYVTPAKRRREERLLVDKHAARERKRVVRFVQSDKPQADLDRDFITFSATRERDQSPNEASPEADYRGFGGDRASDKNSDPDAVYESDLETRIDTEVTQKNSLLIRRTREHPTDLQAWLDLIHHQDAMMKLERASSELSSSDKRHLADIRISTYEEALKTAGTDEATQLTLYCGLLDEASRSWDEGRLASKWQDLLARYPQNVELWIRYLNFVQSNFARFKYESCRVMFFQCLEAVKTASGTDSIEARLHIFVRITVMIQQSGYQELALAIWQAVIEYHLLGPPKSASGRTEDELLRLFEEFWESEAPRIGEEGAKGWRAFNPDDPQPGPPGPAPTQQVDSSRSDFDNFRLLEVERVHKMRYAGRTSDEVGEDDPFHLILFSDIEEYIKIVPRRTSTTVILDVFLCFAGLPPLPSRGSPPAKWLLDPFLQYHQKHRVRNEDASSPLLQTIGTFLSCPIMDFQMTTELLFVETFPLNSATLSANFVRRILKLIAADTTSDEAIGEYLLAFERRHFPSEAFKTAKQLLKARPSSLRLYHAYGLVESHRGNYTKADQVFSTALSMQKGDTPFAMPGSLQLFSSWVWESLRRGKKAEALIRLVSLNGQVPPGQAQDAAPDHGSILRARTVLTELNERALLGQDYISAVLGTSLLALLAYLTSSSEAEVGLAVHHKLTSWFEGHGLSHSSFAELHAQAIAQFLTHHATNASIVRPSLMRTTLEPLLSRFPNNTILLSFYAANEARFSIDDRVRGIVHQRLLQNATQSNIAGWSFAVHYETLRGEIAGSTSHSIRALYKRAEDNAGAHCPAIWKAHVLFELDVARRELAQRPNKRPRRDGRKHKHETRAEEAVRRVKEAFFSGLTKLPWCKDYMMMAFTDLQDLDAEVLTEEELKRVYNVMVEKELRIYIDLESDQE